MTEGIHKNKADDINHAPLMMLSHESRESEAEVALPEEEDPGSVLDRKLRPRSAIIMDELRWDAHYSLLKHSASLKGKTITSSLKGIMGEIIDIAIRDLHLLPDEFEKMMKQSDEKSEDSHTRASGIATALFRSFVETMKGEMKEYHSIEKITYTGETLENPRELNDHETKVFREIMEFLSAYGTEKEEKKMRDMLLELQKRSPTVNVLHFFLEFRFDIRFIQRITATTLDMMDKKFEEGYRQNRYVLDFLFARVIGLESSRIITEEVTRKAFLKYLEKIGFHMENLDNLLFRQPDFQRQEKLDEKRRQTRMSAQQAAGQPVFGLESPGDSFHSWLYLNMVKDIAVHRRNDHVDMTSIKSVSLRTMKRVIHPDKTRQPLEFLRRAMDQSGEIELWKSVNLGNLPREKRNEILQDERRLTRNIINRSIETAISFVPDDDPRKASVKYLDRIADEDNFANILRWFTDPQEFIDKHPEDYETCVMDYNLREHARDDEHLQKLAKRIIRFQTGNILTFWQKARSLQHRTDMLSLPKNRVAVNESFTRLLQAEYVGPVLKTYRLRQSVTLNGDSDANERPFLPSLEESEDLGIDVPQYHYIETGRYENDEIQKYQAGKNEKEGGRNHARVVSTDPIAHGHTGKYRKYWIEYGEEEILLQRYVVTIGGENYEMYVDSKTSDIFHEKDLESIILSGLTREREVDDVLRTAVAAEKGVLDMLFKKLSNEFGDIPGKIKSTSGKREERPLGKIRVSMMSVILDQRREFVMSPGHIIPQLDERGSVQFINAQTEIQGFTPDNHAMYWKSEYSIASHRLYKAESMQGLFREVHFPAFIYPDMRRFNQKLASFNPTKQSIVDDAMSEIKANKIKTLKRYITEDGRELTEEEMEVEQHEAELESQD